ncbi:response regulator [Methanoplanus limicola]|jgi:CheY-like chemotaxis protein|uniref:Response regulator receiver protein n=1 Tax=Methanoplanus limicola DSM 2279 TaxID=937775 RepID=H1Z1W0_9EURY|nr:response regulator [Methanoplanus limicola]EHQ35427.1 response regulator receiver protein [Methanoplanus limicola DSM 2279]
MKEFSILIVEDDAIISMDIEQRVQKLGHKVVGVVDRAEKAFRAIIEKKPDLILMDINLKGGMDGISIADRLYKDMGTRVIYITAYSDEGMKERADKTNPLGYIVKPIRENELNRVLAAAESELSES